MLRIMLLTGIFFFQSLFTTISAAEPAGGTEEIEERIKAFTDDVNQGKTEDLSSFWVDDAVYAKPITGEILEGKNAISEFLQKATKELKARNLTLSFKSSKIDFPNDNTAIVLGILEITDSKGELLQRNARRIELIKQNGNWNISNISEIEVPPAPPIYIHLKDLEWLIGNWSSNVDNVTSTFNANWDKFKNFILQHFKTEIYGVESIEGLQIIGWDPSLNKIHSWVYDSDGGFGSGIWTKNGDSWQAAMNYVLSNGKKASATNIYTKVNDNSFSFSSIDRKINGESIPNVEPVTVVKEK